MRRRRVQLRLKRIDRVALVDRGDNPHAEVVIHKRAPDADDDARSDAPAAAVVRKLLRSMTGT